MRAEAVLLAALAAARTPRDSCGSSRNAGWRILFGEEALRKAVHRFIAHYHTERNHQGLANRPIRPEPGHFGKAGVVQRRQRLGGMLNYYYGAAV